MDNLFTRPVGRRFTRGLSVLALCLVVSACKDFGEEPTVPVTVIDVTVRNTDSFQFPTVGGDEEGARISKQAQHYRVSHMRRNSSTNWVAVYVYQAEAGYVGSDYTELEVFTNPSSRPEHERVSKVGLRFTVTN